jgi:peroxiredoxin
MVAIFRPLLLLIVPVALAQQPTSPATDTQSPFLSIPHAASGGLRFGAQLPEFDAKDISGQTWRFEDLRGKLTLIYIWNTFEARATDRLDPHKRESFLGLPDLPELQRFYDKVRNAKDIQVLTFCTDHDYMHAHDYMKQQKYTFPVIADWVLINKLFPRAGGQPPYWVVNPEGRLSYPFRSWSFGSLLFEVEKTVARN